RFPIEFIHHDIHDFAFAGELILFADDFQKRDDGWARGFCLKGEEGLSFEAFLLPWAGFLVSLGMTGLAWGWVVVGGVWVVGRTLCQMNLAPTTG
ncbi:MAG: hypothetical protein RBT36_08095, partial [Desulfobulbus sp.]|nr:hypothetical protein [Desulfobulbus sp.]